jgi:hypothetical protein
MNDQRFKELLNLYLDQRLEGADAKEFEQALRVDAARRKMLRDYSLIQGGCNELFARAAAQAPSSAALCRSLRAVENRMSRAGAGEAVKWGWRGWTAGFGAAGLGVAACATILVVVRTGGDPSGPTPSIAAGGNEAAPAVMSVASAQRSVSVPVVVAAATDANPPVEVLSERQKARNLTLAALGLTMEDPVANRGGQGWADARETYELANLSPAARNWIRATAASEGGWTQNQSSSLSMQTNAGYSWDAGNSGGYQVEAAAYRFER